MQTYNSTLILIRHAQTSSNGPDPDPLMSGWTDLHLSRMGRLQCDALRRRLLDSPSPDAIYSSPLLRARETAAAACGSRPPTLLDDLREINCGAVDGLRISRVKQHFGDFWEANLRQENDGFRWPGGESYLELRQRSLRTLHQIAQHHPGERVLIFTHAGVISQVIGWIMGVSPARWEAFRPHNTSLTSVLWGTHPRLLRFNDHDHLDELHSPVACAPPLSSPNSVRAPDYTQAPC